MKAPVLVFVYNRPEHTKRVLNSLDECYGVEDHDLFIFSDAPKNQASEEMIQCVREMIKEYSLHTRFHQVKIEYSEKNKGLANSIIDGVSKIINQYGTVIVLEDDLIVSKDFLKYMQDALDFYNDEKKVGAISGYSIDFHKKNMNVYKSHTGNSWGWATWNDRWEMVDWEIDDYKEFQKDVKSRRDFDRQQFGISDMLDRQMRGEINSWAVRWDYTFFKKGLWTIYPARTKVENNGFDGSGVHCGNDHKRKMKDVRDSEYHLIELEKCDDFTCLTSENTCIARGERMIKNILRKTRKVCVTILLLFIDCGAEISRKITSWFYKCQYKLKWTYLNPLFFDHQIDLNYKWSSTQSPMWLKRGVLSNIQIQKFQNAKVLELGCGDGFNTFHFYCDKNVTSVLACDSCSKAIKFAKNHYKDSRIQFIEADIKEVLTERDDDYSNIICDAVINFFTLDEIRILLEQISRKLSVRNGVFSGTAQRSDGNLWVHYATNFGSVEEFRDLLKEYFDVVEIYVEKDDGEECMYFAANNE